MNNEHEGVQHHSTQRSEWDEERKVWEKTRIFWDSTRKNTLYVHQIPYQITYYILCFYQIGAKPNNF
jgi:hypothetical protein